MNFASKQVFNDHSLQAIAHYKELLQVIFYMHKRRHCPMASCVYFSREPRSYFYNCHDITEILLKVVLNTITTSPPPTPHTILISVLLCHFDIFIFSTIRLHLACTGYISQKKEECGEDIKTANKFFCVF